MGRDVAPGDTKFVDSQKVVCFTESPLEHAWMMCADIEGRENGFGPYGIAVTKVWARAHHVNPVWYLDTSARGGRSWLTVPMSQMRDAALAECVATRTSLADHPVAQLLPFIEQMGPTRYFRKEFWWEREWRHVGHFDITDWANIVAVFAPHLEHRTIRTAMDSMAQPDYPRPPLLDPRWGLERMISALRGIPVIRPGIRGGSRPWKRGWSHATGTTT
jgi:hypothetical protein